MRGEANNRHAERYDHYEAILDHGLIALVAKFAGK